jgi:hypothetical protein
MKHRRPAIEKESLDRVQHSRAKLFEYAETERLRNRRTHAIENRKRPAAFHPFSSAVGEQASACLGVLCTCEAFRSFQAF